MDDPDVGRPFDISASSGAPPARAMTTTPLQVPNVPTQHVRQHFGPAKENGVVWWEWEGVAGCGI